MRDFVKGFCLNKVFLCTSVILWAVNTMLRFAIYIMEPTWANVALLGMCIPAWVLLATILIRSAGLPDKRALWSVKDKV
jgi:hypothetical protein